MNEVVDMLKGWQLDMRAVRERMYRAPTARERENWHALWLPTSQQSAAQVAEALETDLHTIGDWVKDFRRAGPASWRRAS